MRIYTLLLCLVAALAAWAQDSAPAADFFSGTVISCSSNEVTVNRQGLGKDSAVTKTFVIDENTTKEGTLKVKAHVTIRFVAADNELRAVHIIVR